ncbi:MAG: hypothetical protein R3320_04895 [Nitriliruptorales bacterium]|nr:hypothetical protein [Nitriliruptorales bacterium]
MVVLIRIVSVVLVATMIAACSEDLEPDGSASPSETSQPTAGDESPSGDATGGSQLAAVALRFDGESVPVASACNGADGAVLATTVGEVTITLVREDGTALRYNGEGMVAETSDVTVEEIGESTIYRATLQSDEVPAVDVELELGDTSTLSDCEGT